MSAPKHAKRRDKSESPLVDDLRARGVSVHLLDVPCDAILGFRGITTLAEFKTPNTYYGRKLNENQAKFQQVWHGSPIVVFRTHEDVEKWCNDLLQKNNGANQDKSAGTDARNTRPR